MNQDLTEHQRKCLEHIRQAQALDLSLSEYARAHGLGVRMLYDAAVQLKDKGVIAGAGRPGRLPKGRSEDGTTAEQSPFVAVCLESQNEEKDAFVGVLRLNHARGHVLEFGSWPPAEVMAAILAGERDDTP